MELLRPITITDALLTDSSIPEPDTGEVAWNAATAYTLGQIAYLASNHTRYERIVAGTTATSPDADAVNWLPIGSTNRWRMFDQAVNSQSMDADEIEVEITPATAVDMVFLQNLAGSEAQVTVTDSVDGVVYDETRSLIADGFIDNWLSYFAEGFARDTEALFADLPALYIGAPITIAVRETGEDVSIGLCIIGQSLDMGGTRWDVETGIDDYSVKTTDDFGNVTVLERAFNKRARFTIWSATYRVGFLQNKMAEYRATPLVFIGSRDHPSTWIYGFYGSMGFVISYPDVSVFDLEVKGLI